MKQHLDRPIEIWGQVDRSRFAVAFGVQPDRREYAARTHRFTSGDTATFIRFWAFVLIVNLWGRSA